eukprot:4617484-Prymnesium_polylepis.1
MRARTSALGGWLLHVPSVVTYHVSARRCGVRRQVTLSLCPNDHHTPQTMSKGTPACAMWVVCPRVQGTERLCELTVFLVGRRCEHVNVSCVGSGCEQCALLHRGS